MDSVILYMHVRVPTSVINRQSTSANLFERAKNTVAKAFSVPSFASVVA